VWGAVVGDHVLDPVFLEGAVNGDRYRELLQTEVRNFLDDLPLEFRATLTFQQDGHPAHRSRATLNLIRELFGRRWIGLGSDLHEWPPRSPDLSIMDFFVWGYVKAKLSEYGRAANVEELKQNIQRAFATITPAMLGAARRSFFKRVAMCLEQDGGHFEQLL